MQPRIADSPQLRLGIDERDLHPVIGRMERRRISAGAGADNDQARHRLHSPQP